MRLGIFGLPGAGKGTQASRLATHLSVPHVSTGDMFRKIQESHSPVANDIRRIMASGNLVSDDMVTELTLERLSAQDCLEGFILDGYPRTLEQAKSLEASAYALDALIYLEIDKMEIVERLSGRRLCERCGSIFSKAELGDEQICPSDGSPLIQRTDDRRDAVKKRLEVYEQNASPILEFFMNLKLLHHIDASGTVDEVFARLLASISKIGVRQ